MNPNWVNLWPLQVDAARGFELKMSLICSLQASSVHKYLTATDNGIFQIENPWLVVLLYVLSFTWPNWLLLFSTWCNGQPLKGKSKRVLRGILLCNMVKGEITCARAAVLLCMYL